MSGNNAEIIEKVEATKVYDNSRGSVSASLFGFAFPLRVEPTIYAWAERLAADYSGGSWEFYTLSNGGFFVAPKHQDSFLVVSPNGSEKDMSAEAFGITATLFAYGQLAAREDGFCEKYTEHYHLLYDFMVDHPEVNAIHSIID